MITKIKTVRIKAKNCDPGGGLLFFPVSGVSQKSIMCRNLVNKAKSTDVKTSLSLLRTSSIAGIT